MHESENGRSGKASRPGRVRTWVRGLDEILGGGLPEGRTTLIEGAAGCGKTVLAMEFAARGAAHGEPAVFLSFEQSREELLEDFSTLHLDLPELIGRGVLHVEDVDVAREAANESGAYGLDGLLIRLELALERSGARRLALDTLEIVLSHLEDTQTLRAELRRLFGWLRERGVTTLVTAERASGVSAGHSLEEYVSDCVVLLDHRVREELSTRRARIVKYRGAQHSADEHPFLIDSHGVSLIPVTAAGLDHEAPRERVSTGIRGMDDLLEGGGYHRAASVLVTGTAGAGKSSVAASFLHAACGRGESCLYLAFEESERQIRRNMASIGLDLGGWIEAGLLHVRAQRPVQLGLEQHLLRIERLMDELEPAAVVVDPISNLITVGTVATTRAMLTRLIDRIKGRGVTALYTALGSAAEFASTQAGVSSLMDSWIMLSNWQGGGVSRRTIHILKSRGMRHSRELRELHMSEDGLAVGGVMDEFDPRETCV